METINGLYKAECIRTTVFHAGPYKTIADVEYATAAWVEWYNNRRLHSSLGNVPPAEYESAHYAAHRAVPTRIRAAENLGRFSTPAASPRAQPLRCPHSNGPAR